ncbi:N-acetylmuramoyl-L-alanine amidase family protein [Clostridium swellfunianum]|uniref:N-acetylmuramoyl-L-alanine amidase family protein n=1 Tax=Clostridium swellfunianum TaxID=1367462 RepID=UPI0020302B9F|nr:N-acetylmuramoyl-L-alanine amidase [Clostridium swellfunianum]
MNVRVKNKRRFGLWCIVFLLMFLNLIFAINKRLSNDSTISKKQKIALNYKVLAGDKDGSITYSESKYFKKYIIDCKSNNSLVKWEEGKEYIDISLKKDEIKKLNIKVEESSENKDIYYDDSSNNLMIKIKKAYNENNFVNVDSNDAKKIVVLIAKEEKPFRATVVLDAGHGGEDKGASYNGLFEKDITLKIVNFTSEELMFNGFKVVKTREKDELLYLNQIAKIANEASADLFVSVHINSNKIDKYKGVSAYYYDVNGFQKDERIKLARTIQKELIKNDNWEDRGIARESLSVLRNSEVPCVLLELGFISNYEDRSKLMKDEVLKNFGINITKGVSNYFSAE